MTVCRECGALLLGTPAACPRCRAVRPGARLAGPAPAPVHRDVAVRMAGAAGVVVVPAALALHTAARWVLPAG